MTTRPETIDVGPLRYRVLWDADEVKRYSDEHTSGDDEEWAAFSDHERLVIGINPEHGLGSQRQSMLHEVMHACLRFAGCWPDQFALLYVKSKRKEGPNVEELIVAALAGPMLGVLGDNPHVIAWLSDDDDG